MARSKYGMTPWGAWFLRMIESYDGDGRVSRGKSYANTGKVDSRKLKEEPRIVVDFFREYIQHRGNVFTQGSGVGTGAIAFDKAPAAGNKPYILCLKERYKTFRHRTVSQCDEVGGMLR